MPNPALPSARGRGSRLAVALAVLVLGAAVACGVALRPRPAAPVAAAPSPSVDARPSPDGARWLLVMVSDVSYHMAHGRAVADADGNTDVMLVMRHEPATGKLAVLSVPRDTRVPIPGHGTFKINAANPYGGPDLALEVVRDTLHVPVDRYALFDTRAIAPIVDAIGGVDLDVQHAMNYDDRAGGLHIHLRAGRQHLNGSQAHDYLRFRHDGQGDLGRIERHQHFASALAKQFASPRGWLGVPGAVAAAKAHWKTNLSEPELADWLARLPRDGGKSVTLGTLPGSEAIIRGGWYWVIDPEAAQAFARRFFDGEPGGV